jgi:hypothetical protein
MEGLFEAALATNADDRLAGDLVGKLPDVVGDEAIRRVEARLFAQDPRGLRTGGVLRDSLDQVLDGPRTRRFRYEELRKTEKTHVGTIVEINFGKAFGLEDGSVMDYRIAGVEVDCKYSMSMWGWEFPLESLGHIVLLTWADDAKSLWSAGLWRVDPRHLQHGEGNRDKKRKMLKSGRNSIRWLWRDQRLDENLLLHLPPEDVDAIFAARNGQQRLNELFRRVQKRIIRREVVLTVGQQKDSPRRARMTRDHRHLGKEGLVVLGPYEWDVKIAKLLGLPSPKSGEWISARVVPDNNYPGFDCFEIDSGRWHLAAEEDPVVSAPTIPRSPALEQDNE